MSGSFRVPKLFKRLKQDHGLPSFDWTLVQDQTELASGAFGTVYLANYGRGDEARKIVIKKLKSESLEAKRRFVKEAEMVNDAKHPNISKFFGFSDSPHAIVMEYEGFCFSPFGVDKLVSNLEDFYHYVDCEYNFEAFADVLHTVTGLEYLHRRNIAHRDLKPRNILVSNQHYCNNDLTGLEEDYAKCPIVCKVADFGLSRSLDAQTQSVLQSRTQDVCRGTPIYMALEIQTGRLTKATQIDLQLGDMWSLGILAYATINPNLSSPYRKEAENFRAVLDGNMMRQFMEQKCLPEHDRKYEVLQVTEWSQIEEVFDACAKFEPGSRPTAMEICNVVNLKEPEASLTIKPLKNSQNTAVETADFNFATGLVSASVYICYTFRSIDAAKKRWN
ncbi:cell division control protein 2 homolog [Dendronephthya gigantea]|uniref:cell division control protein 2 homolog n=1 Tax=Dendronephthya gigantea TaxID=151771 RepID=UPI0010697E26|nr:cell division control protein 2 homolog [Dendronephthya gigantea]